MAAIQCKTEIPSVEGLNDNQLTVGREFLLVCDGEFPKDLAQEKLHFNLKPEEKYQIHLLGFEFRTTTQADVKVTAYKAGNFQYQDLQLSDGTTTLSLGPIQYQVESVLEKPEPGQPQVKQEPFGPIGPASLPVPMLYWALLAGVIGLVILMLAGKVYRVVQRRNMLAKLKEHDSAMSPLAQFHQNLRRLQRTNTVFFGGKADPNHIPEAITLTYDMLKLFLTRRYQMPAMEWSDRLILKDLKKYHRAVYVEYGPDLKNLFKEYNRAIQDKEKLNEQDVLNITTHCRLLVEKMERLP
ncbi:hypothetical protein AZI87_01460 [Bdellovibrio bacteriovorus]|uniref:DUF4381 domain-containing protein n=1 Tax=Bdellovibrio bacteriovorus TaxID=959 RepID=A0A162GEP6_BDEBC|nr:hypothetical protein [Bdellovibrio bacteriovorus]KYG67969.1 hypothetical protein AZI87_01460 [Bdellovibrio bacteriovorus]